MSFTGTDWLSLSDNLLSSLFGSNFLGIVLLDSLDESKSGLRFSQMFKSDVNSLRDDSTVVLLVDNDTNSSRGNVENLTSLTVIVLVRHTLVDGTISNDINVVTNLVSDEVTSEWSGSMLLVRL